MDVFSPSPAQLLKQADRRLAWASDELALMNAAAIGGDLDYCERAFSRILVDLAAAHERIKEASKGIDDGEIAKRISDDRTTDPLLFYFWHARNVDVHHLLEREISSGSALLKVVDREKAKHLLDAEEANVADTAQRLFAAAMGASSVEEATKKRMMGERPDAGLLETLGLAWKLERAALSLLPFSYRNHRNKLIHVDSPGQHLGVGNSNAADRTSDLAIIYYRTAISRLSAALVVQ